MVLQRDCLEKPGTRINLSNVGFDLNFKQVFSQADDLKYAGVKVLEQEWREKHTTAYKCY
jgi:hypothetical protein